MARIRTVKPEFFKHEQLFDAERASGLPLRVAFVGLWCVADREGRFRWRPRTLKSDILPFDELDFGAVLDALGQHGFIASYEVDGEKYGHIPSFSQHQHVNMREAASALPSPGQCTHVQARVEGERERNRKEKDTAPTAPSNGHYAFCGTVIRLNERDFDAWKTSFPSIDLRAKLTALDAWFVENPAKQKRWFQRTASILHDEHETKLKSGWKPPHHRRDARAMEDLTNYGIDT